MTPPLSLCAQEVRKIDHDTFICGLFAPDEAVQDFYALHLFHLETARLRDSVSEAHLGLIRLQWWRDLLAGLAQGEWQETQGTHKEIQQALAKRLSEKDRLDSYLNARSFDMNDQAHDDMAALIRYCQATGGAIAALKSVSFQEDEASIKAAEAVGTAQTLLGFVRTLAHQAHTGRCRLPLDLRRIHGLDMAGFHKGHHSEELKNCVIALCNEVQRLITQGRDFPVRGNAILLATVALEDYMKRLAKADYNPFSPQIRGGRVKRQLSVGWKAMRGRF